MSRIQDEVSLPKIDGMARVRRRNLNAMIARMCGWTERYWTWYAPGSDGGILRPPDYSANLNYCREAELEIERRGLCDVYLRELRRIINRLPDGDTRQAWYMTTADAETRCLAMRAALKEFTGQTGGAATRGKGDAAL